MLARSLFVAALALVACNKADKPAPPPAPVTAPVTAGTVGKDGTRHIEINASDKGYAPERIAGKPGEKLTLVFTRTSDVDCVSKLVTPDGKTVELPMNTPVEVVVTVPQTGKLDFACGMDMFHGVVIAQPAS
ncbi:MAG TPA: cupredoxin domain-containing protein [Kofleriaceae bacterium]|jgi:plastocyanin domain-containing protein